MRNPMGDYVPTPRQMARNLIKQFGEHATWAAEQCLKDETTDLRKRTGMNNRYWCDVLEAMEDRK